MEFPKCYILVHKKYGVYVQNARLTGCFALHVLEEYEKNKPWGDCFFTSKIEVAKLWSSPKKIKAHLTKETAKFYVIVGSDHTITEAEDLFP